MNTVKSTKISSNKTTADWWALRPSLVAGNVKAWDSAIIDYFRRRLDERYLIPIRLLQEHKKWHGEGFAIMAVQCSLIEFLESTVLGENYRYPAKGEIHGVHEYSSSKKAFVGFLKSRAPFSTVFDDASAVSFYINVRCGLVHEARTKGGWRILAGTPHSPMIDVQQKAVYRDRFQDGLLKFVDSYTQQLRTDRNLQEAFLRKFDSLCKETTVQEWVYKATPTIASLNDTRDLAVMDGFLAKAAYENADEKGKQARADHVKAVQVGDIIHFYFREHGTKADEALPIGSFEVTDASPVIGRFAWPVEETHLAQVLDPTFEGRLKQMGYDRDPKLNITTGWLLKRLERDPPEYDRDWFPGNHVLRRYG